MGANRRFIDAAVPHVVEMFAASLDELLESSDCVVVANRDPLFEPVLDRIRPGQVVVDLVRILPTATSGAAYVSLT
jgi:hypothetical protein